MKKFDWITIGLILVFVLSSQIYIAFSPADSLMYYFSIDDAYYYFKTAQNIGLGYGVTFDRINPANGFHPLWMMICLTIFRFFNHDLITPLRVIMLVMGVFNAGTSILLYFLLKKALSPWVAGLGALFWALSPEILRVTSRYGLETGLSIFSIVLFLFVVSRYRERAGTNSLEWKRLIGIGLAAAFALFSRLDNVFLVGVMGMWFVFRGLRISPKSIADFLLSALSVIISFIIRIGISLPYHLYTPALFILLWIAALIRPISFALFKIDPELPESSWPKFILKAISANAVATGFIGAILLTLSYSNAIPSFPRSTLLYDAIISSAFLIGWRVLWKLNKKLPNPGKASNLPEWIKANWKRLVFEGGVMMGPVFTLLAGYFLWNHLNFGTLMPISGQVKHWWGTLFSTVYSHEVNLPTALGLAPASNFGPLSPLTSPLNENFSLLISWLKVTWDPMNLVLLLFFGMFIGLISWLLIARNKKSIYESLKMSAAIPLAIACMLQFSYYQGTNYVGTRSWYWVAYTLLLVILLAIFINGIYKKFIQWKVPAWIVQSALALAAIGLIYHFSTRVGFILSYHPDPNRHDWYLQDARGLEKETEPGSIIGMTGGGTVAYFIGERTIVNLDGLMNSMIYFEAMKHDDVSDILINEKMRYIFSNEYMVTSSSPYQSLFKNQLEKLTMIQGEERFTLFRYLPVP
jgi:hypothetical protein